MHIAAMTEMPASMMINDADGMMKQMPPMMGSEPEMAMATMIGSEPKAAMNTMPPMMGSVDMMMDDADDMMMDDTDDTDDMMMDGMPSMKGSVDMNADHGKQVRMFA